MTALQSSIACVRDTPTMTSAIAPMAKVMVGVSRTQAILLCSAVMIGYSVLGGMWALTATDIVQFAIKTVGILFILLPFAIIRAGGLAGMQQELPTGFFSMSHIDRKSTRLNSSHSQISYAVFCLKKKNTHTS